MSGAVSMPQNTLDDSFPSDDKFPKEELNISVGENDNEGALRAIATYSCAFRHPARLAHIHGMAAAAEKAGFSASFGAFRQAVQMLPNAPEPEVRCAFVSQLVPLAAAWKRDGGAESHAQVVKLMYTALDTLEDDVEEVTSAGQAAVLGIARQLPTRDLRTHLLSALAGLEQHPEDEVRCILAELAANIGADITTISVEADLLPLLLRMASDQAYLVRKEVVFGLPKLAPRLSQALVQSQLLPLYRKLAADRVWLVRAAAASTLPAVAGFLPSGKARAALLDVWQDLASDASKWVMSSALTSLAPYLTLLAPEDITDGLLQQLLKAVDEGAAGADCLVAAAEAFPALAEAAGARRWAALKPVLTALVLSGDQQVIHGLAHSLPRLARLLGPDRAASDWLPALQDMQRVGGGAAAAGLAPQLAELAALVPSEQRPGVLRPLMGALRESASWRVRADLAAQLSTLARRSPLEVWDDLLVPAALQLCQDPVAAVRHAAAAEAAAMAAHLFGLLNPSSPAGPSGTAGAAFAARKTTSPSAADQHEVSAQPPGTAAAAECSEACSASAASQGPGMSTEMGTVKGAADSTHEHPADAQRSGAGPGRGSVQPGEPPDEGEQRRILAALLGRLTSELADSSSFRSRLTFVLVCHQILGLGAVQLLKQEMLLQLLRLARDPVVNVRLALCRLLVQDKGPLHSLSTADVQGSPGRTSVCALPRPSPEPHSTQTASNGSNDHPSDRDGDCPGSAQETAGGDGKALAEVSATGPPHAADALQQFADGRESQERNVSELSSRVGATSAAAGQDASGDSGPGRSSGCRPHASQEKSEKHGDKPDTTDWASESPEIMHALDNLAKDVDPEVNLLASIFLHHKNTV